MDSENLKYFYDLLTDMLRTLENNREITKETLAQSGEVLSDPADRASAESDKAFALRISDRERQLLHKIEEAIQRIEDGQYGICEDCGDPISIPRLKARPMTQLCIECKSRQEEEEKLFNK